MVKTMQALPSAGLGSEENVDEYPRKAVESEPGWILHIDIFTLSFFLSKI